MECANKQTNAQKQNIMKDFFYALKRLEDKLNSLDEFDILTQEQVKILLSSIDQIHNDAHEINRGLK